MKKRLLPALLALVMVVTMLPLSVFADLADTDPGADGSRVTSGLSSDGKYVESTGEGVNGGYTVRGWLKDAEGALKKITDANGKVPAITVANTNQAANATMNLDGAKTANENSRDAEKATFTALITTTEGKFAAVKKLDFTGDDGKGVNLHDFGALVPFTGLEELDISGNTITAGILPQENLTEVWSGMVTLKMNKCGITDINVLANNTTLKTLELKENTGLTNLNALANCTGLTNVDVSGCTGLTDIKGLVSLAQKDGFNASGLTVTLPTFTDNALKAQVNQLVDAGVKGVTRQDVTITSKLSALTVTATGGSGDVELKPAFAAETERYEAVLPEGTTAATISATVDSGFQITKVLYGNTVKFSAAGDDKTENVTATSVLSNITLTDLNSATSGSNAVQIVVRPVSDTQANGYDYRVYVVTLTATNDVQGEYDGSKLTEWIADADKYKTKLAGKVNSGTLTLGTERISFDSGKTLTPAEVLQAAIYNLYGAEQALEATKTANPTYSRLSELETQITNLRNFYKEITKLDLSGGEDGNGIGLTDLGVLAVNGDGSKTYFTGLTELDYSGNTSKDNVLPEMKALEDLTSLKLNNCGLTDVNALAKSTELTALEMKGNTGITNLNALAGVKDEDDAFNAPLSKLTTLDISGCTGLTTLSGVAYCTELTELKAVGCTSVTDISPLAGVKGGNGSFTALSKLSKLDLSDWTQSGVDFGPIAMCPALTEVNLAGSKIGDTHFLAGGTNAAPELHLTKLTKLDLSNTDLSAYSAANGPTGIAGLIFAVAAADSLNSKLTITMTGAQVPNGDNMAKAHVNALIAAATEKSSKVEITGLTEQEYVTNVTASLTNLKVNSGKVELTEHTFEEETDDHKAHYEVYDAYVSDAEVTITATIPSGYQVTQILIAKNGGAQESVENPKLPLKVNMADVGANNGAYVEIVVRPKAQGADPLDYKVYGIGLMKVTGLGGGYVAYSTDEAKNHVTNGYVFIKTGDTGLGAIVAGQYYVVQITQNEDPTKGLALVTVLKAGENGLAIPCNKAGYLSVWQYGTEPALDNIEISKIQNKQVVYQANLAQLSAYTPAGS